jgi:hypothetical protein
MWISNGVIELKFENDLERTMLASIRHLATDIATELAVDMVFYVGGRHPQQPPWCGVLKQYHISICRVQTSSSYQPIGICTCRRRSMHCLVYYASLWQDPLLLHFPSLLQGGAAVRTVCVPSSACGRDRKALRQ